MEFEVKFKVSLPVSERGNRLGQCVYIAEKLSMSLMLRELKVDNIKVDNHSFNLELRRGYDGHI